MAIAGPARPSLLIGRNALVAQLDRASDFESEGREFESLRARQHNSLQIKHFFDFPFCSANRIRVARHHHSDSAWFDGSEGLLAFHEEARRR